LIKKVSAIAVAAGLAVLVLSTPALAHDHGNDQNGQYNRQNTTVGVPIQRCNNSHAEGVVGRLVKHVTNSDKHSGKCDLDNSVVGCVDVR
jgi:hypothetical protein